MPLHSSGSIALIIYGLEGSYSGGSRERIKRASRTRYGSTPSLYKMSQESAGAVSPCLCMCVSLGLALNRLCEGSGAHTPKIPDAICIARA